MIGCVDMVAAEISLVLCVRERRAEGRLRYYAVDVERSSVLDCKRCARLR